MSYIIFEASDGQSSRAINSEEFISLLTSEPMSYWNDPIGSGFAVLYWYPAPVSPPYEISSLRLLVAAKDDFGFHIAHDDSRAKRSFFVAKNPYSSDQTMVEINYAGESMRIAACLFVSDTEAIAIARQFFIDGQRDVSTIWISNPRQSGLVS